MFGVCMVQNIIMSISGKIVSPLHRSFTTRWSWFKMSYRIYRKMRRAPSIASCCRPFIPSRVPISRVRRCFFHKRTITWRFMKSILRFMRKKQMNACPFLRCSLNHGWLVPGCYSDEGELASFAALNGMLKHFAHSLS